MLPNFYSSFSVPSPQACSQSSISQGKNREEGEASFIFVVVVFGGWEGMLSFPFVLFGWVLLLFLVYQFMG